MRRDIIIVGLQAWHTDIGSNCKSIAAELSKRHRVLYVNAPLDRNTILRDKDGAHVRMHQAIREGKAPRLQEVQPNLWSYYPEHTLESINWIPSTALFSLANRVNNRRFAADIRQAIRALRFERYVLFNDNDIFRTFYLKELLRPDIYVYYSRDNLVGVDYWKRHGLKLEPRHIAKADLGTANSSYLASYLRRYNHNSTYIGQGCNLALFDADKPYPLPADLAPIPRPLVGFVGAINTIRLNPDVIRVLATQRPGYSVVLVGPQDEWWSQCDLHGLPNVYFLGKKPMDALPAYVAAFDVCINPQMLNPVTIGNYPLKVDEYLAMGKPVVATRTEAMDVFGDCAYLADGPGDYPRLVDQAILEDSEEKRNHRRRLAAGHTWEQSVALLEKAIDETLCR
jgi:glycosyltransferase involved in cell wall biosynthesis